MSCLQFRFALLNLAALEAPLILKVKGGLFGDDCVFIANDWHGALVPVYLAAKYRAHGVYQNSRSILAVHNLRHQVSQSQQAFTTVLTHLLEVATASHVQLRCNCSRYVDKKRWEHWCNAQPFHCSRL